MFKIFTIIWNVLHNTLSFNNYNICSCSSCVLSQSLARANSYLHFVRAHTLPIQPSRDPLGFSLCFSRSRAHLSTRGSRCKALQRYNAKRHCISRTMHVHAQAHTHTHVYRERNWQTKINFSGNQFQTYHLLIKFFIISFLYITTHISYISKLSLKL